MSVTPIKTVRPRNRSTKEVTKTAKIFIYHQKVNDERVKVFRKIFLNTLDLGRWTVQNWKNNLEVVHTQMEADSMHAIERHLKNKVINVPTEYISNIQHHTMQKKYLVYTCFKKFNMIQFYKSIRPGRCKGNPKVTDIRALRYESNGSILCKTWYKD